MESLLLAQVVVAVGLTALIASVQRRQSRRAIADDVVMLLLLGAVTYVTYENRRLGQIGIAFWIVLWLLRRYGRIFRWRPLWAGLRWQPRWLRSLRWTSSVEWAVPAESMKPWPDPPQVKPQRKQRGSPLRIRRPVSTISTVKAVPTVAAADPRLAPPVPAATPDADVTATYTPERLRDLERLFAAAWGTKILVLGGLTLVPFLVRWKLAGRVEVAPCDILFVTYHGLGVYLWLEVKDIRALDRMDDLRLDPEARAARLSRAVPWERRWQVLGNIVLPLVLLSILCSIDIAGHKIPWLDELRWLL